MNLNGKDKILKEKGWVIIENVFSKEEISELRKQTASADKEKFGGRDLLSNPYLAHVIYDDRILKIASELTGGKPVYYGDSTFMIASSMGRISNGFHKDCADRFDDKAPDWTSEYTIIRVGIYLQDHAEHSEGLVVRTGSHRTIDLDKGKMVNVPTKAGDVVVWYLTTSHSGNAKRVKGIDYPVLVGDMNVPWISRFLYFHLPNFFIQKSEKDRMALFMSFGNKDKHLDRYLKYLMLRRYAVVNWRNSVYIPEALEKLKNKNLEVIDMHEKAAAVNLEETGGYQQMAY